MNKLKFGILNNLRRRLFVPCLSCRCTSRQQYFHGQSYPPNNAAMWFRKISSWRRRSVVCSHVVKSVCYSTAGSTIDTKTFSDYISHLEEEHANLIKILSEGNNSLVDMKSANLRYQELRSIAPKIAILRQHETDMNELQKLLSGVSSEDRDMRELAEQEVSQCRQQIETCKKEIADMLVDDPTFSLNDLVMEVNAGVGGQEAMLFTREIFNMYQNFARYKNLTFQVLEYDISESNGLRKGSAAISGLDAYRIFQYEVGVHRVQRQPVTEKTGRVHTSTMTVAVLHQPTEIEIVLHPKDLVVETCRSSGKGGQHVNTTESAVRIVHVPTGMAAECQQERSQIANRARAMIVLRSRIYEAQLQAQISERKSKRKMQVGTAGRSEKIRTYNFNQDRISDHRLSKKFHDIESFLSGSELLDDMISDLQEEAKDEQLREKLNEFSQKTKKKNVTY